MTAQSDIERAIEALRAASRAIDASTLVNSTMPTLADDPTAPRFLFCKAELDEMVNRLMAMLR